MRDNKSFLDKRLHFYLLLAVVATTLLSWFPVNSLLIVLLTGCRLLDGRDPMGAVRRAFSTPAFLAFLAIFLLELSGFLHTHDARMVWLHAERKATLVAIPFVISAGSFTDEAGFRKLLWAYCFLLASLCCWCLGVAVVHYCQAGDVQVFFYHPLTATLGVNAVYFSAYVLMALLFLLSSAAPFSSGRLLLTGFFIGMLLLLASRLLLVVLVLICVVYLWRYRLFMRPRRLLGMGLLVVLGMGMLAFTNNPVARRYKAILPEEQSGPAQFNGASLRLFIWRNAESILDEEHAWLLGVSSGDGQDLLNQRYIDSGMSMGYLDYNFHNEYVEVLVDSGIIGLCVLLAALTVVLLSLRGTMEGWFVLLVIVLLACTESTLEMQHSVFFACFFSMLPWRKLAILS